jgi:hypothetical protein
MKDSVCYWACITTGKREIKELMRKMLKLSGAMPSRSLAVRLDILAQQNLSLLTVKSAASGSTIEEFV